MLPNVKQAGGSEQGTYEGATVSKSLDFQDYKESVVFLHRGCLAV